MGDRDHLLSLWGHTARRTCRGAVLEPPVVAEPAARPGRAGRGRAGRAGSPGSVWSSFAAARAVPIVLDLLN